MNHLERMQEELKELELKTQKAIKFYNNECNKPNFLDPIQREYLDMQINCMVKYSSILHSRIDYDKKKINI